MDVAVSSRGRRVLWVLFGLVVIFLYTPIILLAIFSVNDSQVPVFPLSGFTTRWYHDVMRNDALLASVRTSAIVGVLTATISVIVGMCAAFGLARRRFRGRAAVSGLVVSPLVIPPLVLAIGMLVFFRSMGFEGGLLAVVLGHSVLALPFVVLVLLPRLERIPAALSEASRDLGASGWATFWLVTFPLLAPATFSAFLISFTLSFDEYPIASFLVGDQPTFPVYLFRQLRFPHELPEMIAIAVVVMLLSLILLTVAEVGRGVMERRIQRRAGLLIGGDG